MRSVVFGACLFLGCSQPRVSSGPESGELIPAEWTVAEDTPAAGDVTTASLQLPAAREISGLVAEEGSRLILRCVHHRVEAFIDTDTADATATGDPTAGEVTTGARTVAIQLDSAPACE